LNKVEMNKSLASFLQYGTYRITTMTQAA
jgi:hypothetical protein